MSPSPHKDDVRQPRHGRKLLLGSLPLVSLLLLSLTTLVSCGDGAADEPQYPDITVNEPTAEALAKGGRITGTVSFSGTAPRRFSINMSADQVCSASNEGEVLTESVVVTDGRLKGVIVRVSKGLEAYTFDYEKTPAVLDQRGCMYVPHVLGVRTYQPVRFTNRDATSHNINTTASKRNQGFNKTTSKKGDEILWQFRKGEFALKTKCDIHPWMQAYIHVVDHPYFAVSGKDGSFALPRQLPPGTYTLEALHPKLGTQTREVTVDGGDVRVDFGFEK